MRKLTLSILILTIVAGILAGCGGVTATPAGEPEDPAQMDSVGSGAISTAHENALPLTNQLVLGTLLLEETENAVAPEQARALLPLWQAVQANTLQGEAETNAVLKQIEGAMTAEQLAAIAAMRLTNEDTATWAQGWD